MKTIKIQLLNVLALGLIVGLSAFITFDQPVDFSGSWVLDVQKSELGDPVPKTRKSMIKILQQQPGLIMEKSVIDSTGKLHSKIDTITFNGKVTKLNVGNGLIIERLMTQAWSDDKQVMTLASKFTVDNNGEPIEFTGSEIWSLADGGKTLTIVNETVLPDRTDKIKLVYTKE
jgi:hypothetical protein